MNTMQNRLNCVTSSVLEGSHAEGSEGHENVDAVRTHLAKITVRSSGRTSLALDLESGCICSRESGFPQHTDAVIVEGAKEVMTRRFLAIDHPASAQVRVTFPTEY